MLVLLGPTACGKTAVSLVLARRLRAEIVSADSRAFFVGLDIVTAKPSAADRAAVVHHLIDSVPIDREYDAMAFRSDCARLVPQIASRGRVPMLVGGGTLYLGAVLRGVFEGPGKIPEFRRSVVDIPVGELHGRLAEVDPAAAARIHENDRLRIVRALEVYTATGKPISVWQCEAAPLPFDFAVFGLRREPDDHRRAIVRRVDAMLADGLVEEADRLRQDGLSPESQAARTIGLPEAWAYLDGTIDRDELAERLVRSTWALVRRQASWFRRERDVVWIDATGRSAEEIAEEIEGRWSERRAGSPPNGPAVTSASS